MNNKFTVAERLEGYESAVLYVFDQMLALEKELSPSQVFSVATDIVLAGMRASETLEERGDFDKAGFYPDNYDKFIRVGINATIVANDKKMNEEMISMLRSGHKVIDALSYILQKHRPVKSQLFGDIFGGDDFGA